MNRTKTTIAVVDDDPRLTESLEELLTSAGYSVRSHQSAAALLTSGLSDVDLLITDIGMPGMNGFELRDAVKKEYPGMPVFLVTGRHEIADQHRAHNVGILFCKPFSSDALLAAIEGALSGQKTGE